MAQAQHSGAARPDSGRTIDLRLLGGFALSIRGVPVALPPTAQRVLAFLALSDQPLTRPYVSGSLWPDSSDARAGASLRTALWRLHPGGHRLVEAHAGHVALAEAVRVDYRECCELALRALHGDGRSAECLAALARPGELLPDWYDDWLELERERYRLQRVRALERLAETLSERRRFAEAAEAGLAAVASDPLRETAHRALIRVFLAEGNAFEAVHQFRMFRSLALRHLGTEPSEETVALVRHLECGLSP